jgi:hypothetical protein
MSSQRFGEPSPLVATDGCAFSALESGRSGATKFRKNLEPFVNAAQKLGRIPSHRVSAGRSRGPAKTDRAENQAIREWAQRKGLEVSPRGRISRAVMEQYEAEAGR